jgi:microcystin-dependent protein
MGWLYCNGRTLNVKDYVFLFNVIGYSYGGNGTTTFNLPNPAGRVPAAIGTGSDANTSSFSIALGSTIGEYVHRLTIPEMPGHNHGVAGGGQSTINNSTSMVSTGITLNDPGHNHGYLITNVNNDPSDPNFLSQNIISGSRVNSGTNNASTTTSFTGIILNDPTHSHVLNPAGGDKAHNNVQPTIGMGNMFIYSGKVNLGSFPYTTGTLLF